MERYMQNYIRSKTKDNYIHIKGVKVDEEA